MSLAPLLKRILNITSLTLIAAVTLTLKVLLHPPLFICAQISRHVHLSPLTHHRVRVRVQVEICVRVRVSAQTAPMRTAQESTALLGCRGDVEEVSAQRTLQVLIQTEAARLKDDKHTDVIM